jgi:large subunit ribosomal protein L21e
MVKRSRGIRSKSRHILRKKISERGTYSITRSLQEFEIGEKVGIDIDPAIHKGMPHPRFQGCIGEIEGRQGEAYLVGIRDGKKHKTLIVRPEHLRRV